MSHVLQVILGWLYTWEKSLTTKDTKEHKGFKPIPLYPFVTLRGENYDIERILPKMARNNPQEIIG